MQRNEQLSSVALPALASQSETLRDLVIALNPALEADAIQVGPAHPAVQRIGANAGVALTGSALQDQQLAPCPWEGDGYCDACRSPAGEASTGVYYCLPLLCAFGTDTADCSANVPPTDAGP